MPDDEGTEGTSTEIETVDEASNSNQNAPPQRKSHCHLLVCLVMSMIFLGSSGCLLVLLHQLYSDTVYAMKPLVVVGAVMIAASFLLVSCILELMFRLGWLDI